MVNYYKCSFSEEQLNALIGIYTDHFQNKLPKYSEYKGSGHVATWHNNGKKFGGVVDLSIIEQDVLRWFEVNEASDDPRWDLFSDLLPYMGKSAVITKMPGLSKMEPHIDRDRRAFPLYFPILNGHLTVSSFYKSKLPNVTSLDSTTSGFRDLEKTDTFVLDGNAFLIDVRKIHGVENLGFQPRVAFGWNFKDRTWKYEDCIQILGDLGYIK